MASMCQRERWTSDYRPLSLCLQERRCNPSREMQGLQRRPVTVFAAGCLVRLSSCWWFHVVTGPVCAADREKKTCFHCG